MKCYVYMVQCADGSLYTGVTNDLQRRIDQHNGLRIGGARYTKMHRPVFLVHIEKYSSRSEALKREHEIKELSHDKKIQLIAKTSKQEILSSI